MSLRILWLPALIALLLMNASSFDPDALPLLRIEPHSTDDADGLRRARLQAHIRQDMRAATSPPELFARFSAQLSAAQQDRLLPALFEAVLNHPLLNDGKPHPEFARAWTAAGRNCQDPLLRPLYDLYYNLAWSTHKETRNFKLVRAQLRPGDTLEYENSIALAQFMARLDRLFRRTDLDKKDALPFVGDHPATPRPEALRLEIARVELDADFAPRGYRVLDTLELRSDTTEGYASNYNWKGAPFTRPGIYRLSVLDEEIFQEDLVRVSNLDMVVKQDARTLLVWGASLSPHSPPPYRVHIQKPDGSWLHARTDSGGLYATHYLGGAPGTLPIRVILEKEGEAPAITELDLAKAPGPTHLRPALWSDRPLYEPGETVQLRGLAEGYDSLRLSIDNGNATEHRTLATDAQGFFGDSLPLDSLALQGDYELQVDSVFSDGWKDAYRLDAWYGHHFKVQHHRRSNFRLEAEPVQATLVQGTPAQVRVRAAYAWGAPLGNALLIAIWKSSEYFWGGQAFLYDEEEYSYLRGDILELNEQGEALLQYPTHALGGQLLTCELQAYDAGHQMQQVRTSLRILPHALNLGARIEDRWNQVLGDSARLDGTLRDLHDQPVDQELTLTVHRAGHKQALFTRTMRSHGGVFSARLPLRDTGYYQYSITTRDPQGRTARWESTSLVRSQKYRPGREAKIVLLPDQDSYAVGDTARIGMQQRIPAGPALLLYEGKRLHFWHSGPAQPQQQILRIPIVAGMGSLLRVAVLFTDSSGVQEGWVDIPLRDSSSQLQAHLRLPQSARPGDTVQAEIQVSDAQGRPAAATFSVSVADAELYAHMSRPTLPHWRNSSLQQNAQDYQGYAVRGHNATFGLGSLDRLGIVAARLRTASASDETGPVPWLHDGSKRTAHSLDWEFNAAQDPPTADDQEHPSNIKPLPQARERKEFRALAYWNPDLRTDRRGRATLRIPLPDDLARWRIDLKGGDGHHRVLVAQDSFATTSDLLVQIQAPAQLVEGDSLQALALVHNQTDSARTVRLQLQSTPGATQQRTLTVPARGSASALWPVRALRPGPLTLQAQVRSGERTDAETRTVAVIPRAIREHHSLGGQWEAGQGPLRLMQHFPTGSADHPRSLEISYSPSLAAPLFASLDYLTGFPYGCVEQTLNRFIPNHLVVRALRSLGTPNAQLESRLALYDSLGLEILRERQHPDGSWGWWNDDPADLAMTALALEGLQIYLEDLSARLPVFYSRSNEDVRTLRNRGRQALETLLRSPHNTLPARLQGLRTLALLSKDTSAFTLNPFTRPEPPLPRDLQRLLQDTYNQRARLGAGELATLAETLHLLGHSAQADSVIVRLEALAETDASSVHWNSTTPEFNDSEETTALAVRALLRVRPQSSLIARSIPWFVRRMNGGYWQSTRTTGTVVAALAGALAQSPENHTRATLSLNVNQQNLTQQTYSADTLIPRHERLQVPDHLLTDSNIIHMDWNGRGRLYYTASWKYYRPLPAMPDTSGELALVRRYFRVIQNPHKQPRLQPLQGPVRPGETITVQITLRSHQAHQHLLLEDFVPAGLVVQDLGHTASHQEQRPDRVAFFITTVPAGNTTLSYTLRAEKPGQFWALPARAELMYQTGTYAFSAAERIAVHEDAAP